MKFSAAKIDLTVAAGAVLGDSARKHEAIRFRGSRLDLDELFVSAALGMHSATQGAVWQALVMGFGGIRPTGDALLIDEAGEIFACDLHVHIGRSSRDEVVKVTNGKAGTACLRSDIHTAVVVERFARRPLSPRTTNLILLNEQGRTLLMLGGLLWPMDVLRRVIAMVEPAEVVDVPGRQTPKTLAARFPRILERADPEP